MQLGISSFAFGWAVGVPNHLPPEPMDARDVLRFAREQALDLVQFGDHLPLHACDSAELAKLAAFAQLNPPEVTVEVGARGLTAAHLERNLAVARRLKAKLLRFVIDAPGYEPAPVEVTALLREAAPALAAAGVSLGVENHDRFAARTLRRIIEAVGSAHVGVCLDTANSLGAGEGLATVLDQLGPLTINLHLKDFTIHRVDYAMGFVVEGRPAGEGMLDIPALLADLHRHGRCRTVVLETWTPPEAFLSATIAKERRWAEASLAYLKPFFPHD